MNLQLSSFLIFLTNVGGGNSHNDFIVDYFTYKQAPVVVGFSCNTVIENLSLFKELSNAGISTMFSNENDQININKLIRSKYYKLGVFIDLRCYNLNINASVFDYASDNRIFDELRYWLVIGIDLAYILKFIDDRTFGMSTDLVIAEFSNKPMYCKLYDIYNISKERGSNITIVSLGSWYGKNKLNINLRQSKFNRRSNLKGLHLKAIYLKSIHKTKNVSLEEFLSDHTHAAWDTNAKFGFHILNHLADIYNFTLENYESSDWVPGDQLGPVVVAVRDNIGDFVGSPLTTSTVRLQAIKFSHQDWVFRTLFLFRNPQPKTIKIYEVLRPFRNEIWLLMMLLCILILIILIVVNTYEETNFFINISNSFMIIFGAMCQQGTDVKMKRLSIQIVFLFTLIFSLLMYNYYSAEIVSSRLAEPIRTINDSLVELGKLNLQMATEAMAYLNFFLHQQAWDTKTFYENYWLKLPQSNLFLEPEIGMQLVRKGGFAYHTHPGIAYPIIEKSFDNREICELMEVHLARPTYAAFAVGINSTFFEMSKIGLSRISEVGLKHRQILRWSCRKPLCRKDIRSSSSVNMYEFLPHLILLVIGMILAIFVYVTELIIFHFTNI